MGGEGVALLKHLVIEIAEGFHCLFVAVLHVVVLCGGGVCLCIENLDFRFGRIEVTLEGCNFLVE